MAFAIVSSNDWISGVAHPGTSVSKAFGVSTTAGSLLVAVSQVFTNEASPTFSDSKGNTWANGVSRAYDGGMGVKFDLGYALVGVGNGGATTVTATGTANVNRDIIIAEFTGAAAASIVDGTAVSAAGSSSSSMDPGAITTTQTGLVIGAAIYSGPAGTPTPTNGAYAAYNVTTSGDYTFNICHRITSGALTNEHPSWSAKDFWLALGIAFKDAGGGGAGISPFNFKAGGGLVTLGGNLRN
jgi:hypothetical protein